MSIPPINNQQTPDRGPETNSTETGQLPQRVNAIGLQFFNSILGGSGLNSLNDSRNRHVIQRVCCGYPMDVADKQGIQEKTPKTRS